MSQALNGLPKSQLASSSSPRVLRKAATLGAVPEVIEISKTAMAPPLEQKGVKRKRTYSGLGQQPPSTPSTRSSNSSPSLEGISKGGSPADPKLKRADSVTHENKTDYELTTLALQILQDPHNTPEGQLLRKFISSSQFRSNLLGNIRCELVKKGDYFPFFRFSNPKLLMRTNVPKSGTLAEANLTTTELIGLTKKVVMIFLPKVGLPTSDQLAEAYIHSFRDFKQIGIERLVFVIKGDPLDVAQFLEGKDSNIFAIPDPELEFTHSLGLTWSQGREGFYLVPKPAVVVIVNHYVEEVITFYGDNLRSTFTPCMPENVYQKVKDLMLV